MRKLTVMFGAAAVALAISGCGQDAGKKDAAKTAKADAKKGDKAKDDKAKDDKAKDAPAGDPIATLAAGMEAWSAGDFDKALEAFTDDAEWHVVGGPPPFKGKEAIKKAWTEFRGAFPDIKVGAERIVDGGDTIFAQGVSNGTHKGEFQGIPASDKPIGNQYMHVLSLKDGKISKALLIENGGNLMAQIGAAPEGSPPALPPPSMPSAPEIVKGEANPANIEAMKKWYAAFDWDVCEKELCAEGVIHHDVAEGKTVSKPEEHKAELAKFKTAFPDMTIEVTQAVSAGDWVAVVAQAKGTHKGDFGPIKATGKSVDVTYSEVIKFEGGKMKESWGYMNPMEMMGQLGLLPPAPGGTEVAQK